MVDEGELIGRDGQIRTADPSHPKRVLYQAEPRPDITQPVHKGGPAFGVIDSLHGCACSQHYGASASFA
jgi:hypothetical protein